MAINTLTTQEYNQDTVKSRLTDIFEPEKYIAQKPTLTGFEDIKTKLFGMIENIISPVEMNFDEQLNEKFLNLDFGAEFDINADKIGVNDAIFFLNLLNKDGMINYSVENEILNVSDINNKKINATNSLLNMLQTSLDTKKPIRLDFDNDVTVILKLDRNGKIQAHFIPGTSEVETYLRNNISCLKQTFEEEKINYSYIGYSKHKNNKDENSKKQKRSN